MNKNIILRDYDYFINKYENQLYEYEKFCLFRGLNPDKAIVKEYKKKIKRFKQKRTYVDRRLLK